MIWLLLFHRSRLCLNFILRLPDVSIDPYLTSRAILGGRILNLCYHDWTETKLVACDVNNQRLSMYRHFYPIVSVANAILEEPAVGNTVTATNRRLSIREPPDQAFT